jgi:hypothetical protein
MDMLCKSLMIKTLLQIREETAKYAEYAKSESFRGKGLDFSCISRISRFKEFLSLFRWGRLGEASKAGLF